MHTDLCPAVSSRLHTWLPLPAFCLLLSAAALAAHALPSLTPPAVQLGLAIVAPCLA